MPRFRDCTDTMSDTAALYVVKFNLSNERSIKDENSQTTKQHILSNALESLMAKDSGANLALRATSLHTYTMEQ